MVAYVRLSPFLASAIVCLFASMASADEPKPETPKDVSDLLTPLREKHKVAALAVAVIEGDRLSRLGAVGLRARGSEAKVELGDRWHIGSCTKAMTATLCARMIEQGKLKWDTKVSDIFIDKLDQIHADLHDATLEQLLTHRAGLEANPPFPLLLRLTLEKGSRDARETLLSNGWLKSVPQSAPGTKWLYSNSGFMLAGMMAERTADKDWELLMREQIFEPLEMKSAGFGAPGSADEVDQPRGHLSSGFGLKPGPTADNPRGLGPAGTVHCSLQDWSKFIALHLQAARGECRLLTAESFQKLHEPHSINEKSDGYACGWLTLKREWGDGPVLFHNGSNTKWYCDVWIAPKRNFAVMAVTNVGGPNAAAATDAAVTLMIEQLRAK